MPLIYPTELWLPPKPAIIRPAKMREATAFAFGGTGHNRQTPIVTPESSGQGANSGSTSIALSSGSTVNGNDFLVVAISRAGASGGAQYAGRGMTLIATGGPGFNALYVLSVANTSGISGSNNVTTTTTGGSNGMFAAVYRVSNADPSLVAATFGTTSISMSATTAKQIAMAFSSSLGNGTGGAVSIVWSGVAEDFDNHDAAQLNAQSGGHSGLAGPGTFSITATQTGGLGTATVVGCVVQGHA